MKKWLIVFCAGVVIFGLGISISIFEFSNYRIVDPPKTGAFAESTETFYMALTASDEITLRAYQISDKHIQVFVDNNLNGQMRIEITGPNELVRYYLGDEGSNQFYLFNEIDPFKMLAAVLEGAKNNVFYNFDNCYDSMYVALYMNEADLARYKPYDRIAEQKHRDSLEEMRNQYEDNLNEMRTQYEENITEIREQYEERLENMREDCENQLQEQRNAYSERLDSLNEQINSLRNE